MTKKKKIGIHIKKKNEGKFSTKAKAHGMTVQAYAAKVLSDPKASPALKREANFAKNSKTWNHKQ
ncbi:MAG: hypothetical protein ABSE06_01480 [Anaerolineaceae bacterium]|jgi:hypothetical protein